MPATQTTSEDSISPLQTNKSPRLRAHHLSPAVTRTGPSAVPPDPVQLRHDRLTHSLSKKDLNGHWLHPAHFTGVGVEAQGGGIIWQATQPRVAMPRLKTQALNS